MTDNPAAQQYNVEIHSRRQLHELQRLEQTHGTKVHDWLDEGMPREAMGTPSEMRAFRTRKQTAVPDDQRNVEVQNDQPVQPSANTASEAGVQIQRVDKGDSKTSNGSYSDPLIFREGRRRLLEGGDFHGTKIQGAVQQQGPTCYLAMLQAALTTIGRDTRSLAALIQDDTPDPLGIRECVTDQDSYSVSDAIAVEQDSSKRKIVEDVLSRTQYRSQFRMNHPDVKSTAFALMNVAGQNATLARNTPQKKQSDEDLATGKNLLRRLIENKQTIGERKQITWKEEMEDLKTEFMSIISGTKTPAQIGFQEGSGLQLDRRGLHTILLSSIGRDEKGNTAVDLRDGNDSSGEIQKNIPLNMFLSVIHGGTLREKVEECRLYGPSAWLDKMTVSGFELDENTVDELSKPIDTAHWPSLATELESKNVASEDGHNAVASVSVERVIQQTIADRKARSTNQHDTQRSQNYVQHAHQLDREYETYSNAYNQYRKSADSIEEKLKNISIGRRTFTDIKNHIHHKNSVEPTDEQVHAALRKIVSNPKTTVELDSEESTLRQQLEEISQPVENQKSGLIETPDPTKKAFAELLTENQRSNWNPLSWLSTILFGSNER